MVESVNITLEHYENMKEELEECTRKLTAYRNFMKSAKVPDNLRENIEAYRYSEPNFNTSTSFDVLSDAVYIISFKDEKRFK